MDIVDLLTRPEGKTLELKRGGIEDGVYVRVGSTNRRVGSELIEELRRFSRSESKTSRRSRDRTRKRSTSERLPSRLHRSARSGRVILQHCV